MRKFFIAAAVAVAALVSSASSANAAMYLRISTTGAAGLAGATVVTGTFNAGTGIYSVSGSAGGLSITGTGFGATATSLTVFDLAVSGALTAGSYDIIAQLEFDELVTAPPPQTLSTVFTGSIGSTNGGTLAATAQTWVVAGTAVGATFPTAPAVATSGLLALNTNGGAQFSTPVQYTSTAQIRIAGTTNSVFTAISTDSNNTIFPAPAPAGLVLALVGMPCFGLGAYIRRRRGVKA